MLRTENADNEKLSAIFRHVLIPEGGLCFARRECIFDNYNIQSNIAPQARLVWLRIRAARSKLPLVRVLI